MRTFSLQITYRKGEPFAAYIDLATRPGQKSARTEEAGPELVVDYAADGTPIGIEIISPGHVTLDEINTVFDRLGLGRPEPAELAPLGAARAVRSKGWSTERSAGQRRSELAGDSR